MRRSSRRTQGAIYLIVGAYNVAFTLGIFWILNAMWGSIFNIQVIYWTSAIVGVINGFIFQRVFVWRSQGRWRRELIRFGVVNAVVAIVNSLLLGLAVAALGLPAFPTQVAITGVLVVATFFVNRHWVFRSASGASDDSHEN